MLNYKACFRSPMSDNLKDSSNPSSAVSDSLAHVDSMGADIARLDALLSQPNVSADDADVAELLKRLDNAGGMAEELEVKLDGILEKLDRILMSLDGKEEGGTVFEENQGRAGTPSHPEK